MPTGRGYTGKRWSNREFALKDIPICVKFKI